jgi:hypothetical protein
MVLRQTNLIRHRAMTVALLRARWLPVVVAMFLASRGLSAQAWIVGVNAGAGQGGYRGSQEFDWSHLAPGASVFRIQPFALGLWVQEEIGYSRKIGVSQTPSSKLTLAADYLEIPVLVQYRWRAAASVSPFVQAGPGVAIRMRCTLRLVGSGVATNDDCDVVRGEISQRVDVTINGGVGLAMNVAGTRLTLEGRANTGLLASAAPVEAPNSRSFGWSVMIGASRIIRGLSAAPGSVPGPRTSASVPNAPATSAPVAAPELPPIASATIITPDVDRPSSPRPAADPLAALGTTRLVSVHATNADARTLLVAVAREAGLNLVVDGDVRARVSVALTDVPAADAIRAIIESAGLAISGPSMSAAATSIVFYQLPVNIDRASAATIAARFGTSAELANFIVESRPQPPKNP